MIPNHSNATVLVLEFQIADFSSKKKIQISDLTNYDFPCNTQYQKMEKMKI